MLDQALASINAMDFRCFEIFVKNLGTSPMQRLTEKCISFLLGFTGLSGRAAALYYNRKWPLQRLVRAPPPPPNPKFVNSILLLYSVYKRKHIGIYPKRNKVKSKNIL